jgi:trans-2,3-dihydro-3-hydroxyanthranilate isomerase
VTTANDVVDPAPALDFHVVDVFTDRPYAGNPLAVVLDADELSTAQLQAIAREFNLSETAFPMRPTDASATYRVRIFTPAAELPFAGHPSVGTAWLLARLGRIRLGAATQECGAGLLPVSVTAAGATLTGGEPRLGDVVDAATATAAVGLAPGGLVGTPVRWAGVGIDFLYLHARDDAVAAAAPDLTALAELGGAGVVVMSFADAAAHARVFAGGVGVPEDPATGSAALALGVFLVDAGLLAADGESAYVVDQGVEMGRPSRLECTVVAAEGRAVRTTVTGGVVPVSTGRITVPAVS